MVFRAYVEKKPEFAVEAAALRTELTGLLGITGLASVRLVNRYDVEGIDRPLFDQALTTVFSEPPVDILHEALPAADWTLAVEYLPGQFDQRANSAAECIQLLSCGERPLVSSARVYLFTGDLSPLDRKKIQDYVINPVEARQAELAPKASLAASYPAPPTCLFWRALHSCRQVSCRASSPNMAWPWTKPTSPFFRTTSSNRSVNPP